MKMILLLLPFVIFTGCLTPKIVTVQKVKIERVYIPVDLIKTDALPVVPKVKKQSDVADYIINLWDYASECRENMISIKKFNSGKIKKERDK